ncbi:MAG: hypothetical protein J6Y94_04285 [Bacteriovoracaceae bacterium]|nr:hypothetical protein [Bacteriovoracaceae bacterium]
MSINAKTKPRGLAILEATLWASLMLSALLCSFKIYAHYQQKTMQVERDFYAQWKKLGGG